MDLILLILLLLAALLGWRMGLIQQVVSLVGFALSVVVGVMLAPTLAPLAVRLFGTGEIASRGIACVVVTLVGTILLSWVAALVTHVVDAIHLGALNRTAGVVLSVVKYAIVLGFILKALLFVGTITDESIDQSLLGRPLTTAADAVLALIHSDNEK